MAPDPTPLPSADNRKPLKAYSWTFEMSMGNIISFIRAPHQTTTILHALLARDSCGSPHA